MKASAQQRDEPSLEERLERHHGEAFAWAMTCCRGDRTMAEDVLQSAYLKVLGGRASFAGRSSFTSWLFAVIRNTAIDGWRSAWRRGREPLDEDDPKLEVPCTVEPDYDLNEVARAFGRLPARQAEVLSLVYGHGMTLREAAQTLGIAQGSVATHLHRGKRRLRGELR